MVISLEWIDVTVCKRNQHSVGGQLYFKNKQTHKKRLDLWLSEVGYGGGMDEGSQRYKIPVIR